jgi:hypothetical protein
MSPRALDSAKKKRDQRQKGTYKLHRIFITVSFCRQTGKDTTESSCGDHTDRGRLRAGFRNDRERCHGATEDIQNYNSGRISDVVL